MRSNYNDHAQGEIRCPSVFSAIRLFAILLVGVVLLSGVADAAANSGGAPPLMVLPGKFNVSAAGSATYAIPINITPGTSGLAPALSLNYSSQSGNGIEGQGWSMGGLSAVSRCPRTLAQDSVHGSVNYDSNDRFCLDGQRLILISGTYGADGSEYRTEIESFSKIIAHGSAGTGPAWFEVHTKAGQIMEFGNTTDSRVLVVDAVSGVTATAQRWAVDKVSDTVGNYFTITYNCSAVSGSCTDSSRTAYGEAYPLEIDYTGNASANISPYNSVRFSYSGRSDSTPIYQAGGYTQTTVLLTNIKSYQSSNLVLDYQLAYRAGTSAQNSRLTSVTLCDGGSPQKCLNPTTFGWQGGQGYLAMTATSNPLSAAQGSQIIPGDYNGDGLTDVMPIKAGACSPYNIYIGTNGMGINPIAWGSLSTPADGATTCTISPLAQGLKTPNGIPYLLTQILATFPGPVTTNNLVMVNNWSGNVEVQSYSPSGTPPTLPGDYNGDGLIDFFSQINPTSYAYFGNGASSFTPDGGHSGLDPSNTEIAAADFDGDGCTDILALPTFAGGGNAVSYFCNPAVGSVTPPSTVGYNITLGDFNGDGKADILLTSTSGVGKLYFSTGTSFVLSSCSVPSGWGNYKIIPGSWNGDGKADLLLVPVSNPGTAQVWISTGNCFAQAVDASNNPITIHTVTSNPNAVVADWNNDGASDIWMQEPAGSASPADDQLYTFNYTPELMTSVSNGVGSTTNIAYDRINKNGTFYEEGSSATYPTLDINGAFYVVSRVDLSNGLGTCNPSAGPANCYSSTYAYAAGQTGLTGRGFLGFAQVTISDLQTNIVQTTNYNLAFPYTGTIASQTKRYLHNSNELSSVTNNFANNSGCSVTPPSGVYFVCLLQAVTAGVDLNDTAVFPSTTTNYTYDSYGNALTVNVAVSDGSSKNTTNTYNNDTTNWFLGQLLTTSVNSIVGSSNLTRASSFAYSATNGLLTQEAIEPGVSTCNGGSDPCTLTTSYTYDAFGHRVVSQVSGTGITTRMTYAGYDSLGQFQTYAMNALGQAETWAHDLRFGDPTKHTGPNGLSTNWTYDTFGRMTLEARPDGTQTAGSYAYCSGSCPTNGVYLAQAEIFAPNGYTQIGPVSTGYYDMLSRPVANDTQGFDGSNVRVSNIYDVNGNVSQSSRPYFTSAGTPKYSTFLHDALGRVTQAIAPDASVTTNVFNGLVTSFINSLGQTKVATKNAQGLNASIQDAAGKTTSYVYDATGDLVIVTDPAGNVITNSFDIRGNKYQSVDPDMGTWTYVHDVLGELTGQTDAKSQATSLTYDVLARVLTRTESGLFSTWSYGTSFSNHNIGQLVEAKACTASGCASVVSDRTFSFDNFGRPSANVLQTGGNYFGYETAYNAINGQIASVVYPTGFQLGYSYNSFGYQCLLEQDQGNFGCTNPAKSPVIEAVNSRDAEGHLTQSTAGNGVVTNQTFDPNTGLPLSVRAGSSGSIASFDYTFDAIGNLTARTDHNESYTEGFCYDNLNRLTNYAVGGIGAAAWGSENWGAFVWGAPCGLVSVSNWGAENWGGFVWGATCVVSNCKAVLYDSAGIGNIASKSDVGTYNYPSAGSARPHAISSITGTVDGLTNPLYRYDNNGNLTCISTGSSCTGTIGRKISLTAFNMAATVTEGSTTITFTYDSEHQRVKQAVTVPGLTTKTTYLNDPSSGASSEEVIVGSGTLTWTEYVKLDGNIVAQRTANFTTTTWGSANWGSFVWGASISASNWGAHNWGSFNWAGAPSASWKYFTLDNLGSVSVITDASGTVVQRLSYDAWGKQRNPNGTDVSCGTITSSTTRGFTNQEQMPDACLVNLNARIYDPVLGKFMSSDPTVPDPYNGQAFNRYAYVLNNPLSFTDPSGYSSSFFGSIFSAIGDIFEGGYNAITDFFISGITDSGSPFTNPTANTSIPGYTTNPFGNIEQVVVTGTRTPDSQLLTLPGESLSTPNNITQGFAPGGLSPAPSSPASTNSTPNTSPSPVQPATIAGDPNSLTALNNSDASKSVAKTAVQPSPPPPPQRTAGQLGTNGANAQAIANSAASSSLNTISNSLNQAGADLKNLLQTPAAAEVIKDSLSFGKAAIQLGAGITIAGAGTAIIGGGGLNPVADAAAGTMMTIGLAVTSIGVSIEGAGAVLKSMRENSLAPIGGYMPDALEPDFPKP